MPSIGKQTRKRLADKHAQAAAWPAEKRDKAKRLFDATMALIAAALDVSVEALLAEVASARLAAAIEPSREDDEAELAALDAAELAVDADVEEQEQIELGGAEVSSTAAPPVEAIPEPPQGGALVLAAEQPAPEAVPLFRLKRRGEYVDKSGVGSTRNLRHAWQGNARQIEAIYRRRPEFLDFDAEPVHA